MPGNDGKITLTAKDATTALDSGWNGFKIAAAPKGETPKVETPEKQQGTPASGSLTITWGEIDDPDNKPEAQNLNGKTFGSAQDFKTNHNYKFDLTGISTSGEGKLDFTIGGASNGNSGDELKFTVTVGSDDDANAIAKALVAEMTKTDAKFADSTKWKVSVVDNTTGDADQTSGTAVKIEYIGGDSEANSEVTDLEHRMTNGSPTVSVVANSSTAGILTGSLTNLGAITADKDTYKSYNIDLSTVKVTKAGEVEFTIGDSAATVTIDVDADHLNDDKWIANEIVKALQEDTTFGEEENWAIRLVDSNGNADATGTHIQIVYKDSSNPANDAKLDGKGVTAEGVTPKKSAKPATWAEDDTITFTFADAGGAGKALTVTAKFDGAKWNCVASGDALTALGLDASDLKFEYDDDNGKLSFTGPDDKATGLQIDTADLTKATIAVKTGGGTTDVQNAATAGAVTFTEYDDGTTPGSIMPTSGVLTIKEIEVAKPTVKTQPNGTINLVQGAPEQAAKKASYTLDLTNLDLKSFANGDEYTFQIGEASYTITIDDENNLADVVESLAQAINAAAAEQYVGSDTPITGAKGGKYTAEYSSGTTITLKSAAEVDTEEELDELAVTVTSSSNAAKGVATAVLDSPQQTELGLGSDTNSGGNATFKADIAQLFKGSFPTPTANGRLKFSIGEQDFFVDIDNSTVNFAATIAEALVTAIQGQGSSATIDIGGETFTVSVDSGSTLKFVATKQLQSGPDAEILEAVEALKIKVADGSVNDSTVDKVQLVQEGNEQTPETKDTYTLNLSDLDVEFAAGETQGDLKFTVAGKEFTVTVTQNDNTAAGIAALLAKAINDATGADALADTNGNKWKATANNDGTITLSAADPANQPAALSNTTLSVEGVAGTRTEGDPPTTTNATLTADVDVSATNAAWQPSDSITFEVGGSELKFTLDQDGKTWIGEDVKGTFPAEYGFEFDGSKLTITAKEAGEKDSNPFGEGANAVKVKAVSIGGQTSPFTDATKVTVNNITWTNGTGKTEEPDDTDKPVTPETKPGAQVESGELVPQDIAAAITEENMGKTLEKLKEDPDGAKLVEALENLKTTAGKDGIQINGEVAVDLSGLDIKDSDTLKAALGKIRDAAKAAIEKWNNENSSKKNYKYEFKGLSIDGGDSLLKLADVKGLTIVAEIVAVDKGTSSGTIDVGLQNVTDNNSGAAAQLANTVVNFEKVNAWQDGTQIKIGETIYTVALSQDSKFKNVTNAIDLTDLTGSEENFAKTAAQRLTVAAKDNSIFIGGHDGDGNTTLKQRSEVKETTDMSTKEKVLSYLGVSMADANSVETAKAGSSLTLQIGDTADSYNQLRVSIGDCHTVALGIDGISIADQDSAALAVDKIRAAINYVSDVRGTLGATQNRLDHTINNLSVMTENIQDAESTIRDTDIAAEMMAYTKNNILVQAAQAMLAQANMLPQGVLQLLG